MAGSSKTPAIAAIQQCAAGAGVFFAASFAEHSAAARVCRPAEEKITIVILKAQILIVNCVPSDDELKKRNLI